MSSDRHAQGSQPQPPWLTVGHGHPSRGQGPEASWKGRARLGQGETEAATWTPSHGTSPPMVVLSHMP